MLQEAKMILNNGFTKNTRNLNLCQYADEQTIIPDEYNFREEHSECAGLVMNQGNCSSAYAVSAASTLSDRFCLKSATKTRVNLNPQTYTSCDVKMNDKQCEGGFLTSFFDYVRREGLLTTDSFEYNEDIWETKCPETDAERYKITDYCAL